MSRGVSARLLVAPLVCTALASSLLRADPGPRSSEARRETLRLDWSGRSGSFDMKLDDRLRREARRFPDLTAPREQAGPEADSEPDEGTRAAVGRRVERLLTRALRGAIDDHLSERARESGALSGLFRFFDGRDDGREEAGRFPSRPSAAPLPPGAGGAPAAAGAGPDGAAPPSSFRTVFRLRLDAHPRLQLRARMGPVTGSVEVPVLDPELRFGLERPLGSRGRAALQGGHSGDRGGWASLALNFSF
jgi:hypothetical protein